MVLNANNKKWLSYLLDGILIVLILTGVMFRLNWVNWSQGANLHPDEYGLTNTLTHLSIPESVSEYFNTRVSSISPYQKYDIVGNPTVQGPDNRMRWGQWPIIIIRFFGELTDNTGYNEIRLAGRSLSALADIISILLIFLIGKKLYGDRTGLLAAALSSLAVMQIQQSHFMTVDNFAVTFAVLAMYACVQIAKKPGASRDKQDEGKLQYKATGSAWPWYVVFGVAFGMALASKINLVPLGGMLLIAAFISVADLKLKTRQDLRDIARIMVVFLFVSFAVSLLVFRVTQPMSFRAKTGDTTLFTLHLNQDWVDSMEVAAGESKGVGGGPPAEQWANRPAIIFPLVNMLFWGMGLPLGITAWAGFLWAAWRSFRQGVGWRAHLLPLVWVGGYFFFMGTRWVKSVRYFLPIYPFLCLFAAWFLIDLWHRRDQSGEDQADQKSKKVTPGRIGAAGLAVFVVLATLLWANAFVGAIYRTDHTRIQAARWIYQNVPAPFMIEIETVQGQPLNIPVGAMDGLTISRLSPFTQTFHTTQAGIVQSVSLSHVSVEPGSQDKVELEILLADDVAGSNPLARAVVTLSSADDYSIPGEVKAAFQQEAALEKDKTYFLIVSTRNSDAVNMHRTVLANENWDEGLPFPFDGYDPFGQFYKGMTMEVRWHDDENKRQMFIDTLVQVDYVILPSQRGIWSSCRLPLNYPMTLAYYEALFDGSLGFELVAQFQSPLRLGSLYISDVGGTAAWNENPSLPLFNYNLLAAEEAFSVYDHPPVWIFKKSADFDIKEVVEILDAIDLGQVVVQSPREVDASLYRNY